MYVLCTIRKTYLSVGTNFYATHPWKEGSSAKLSPRTGEGAALHVLHVVVERSKEAAVAAVAVGVFAVQN